MSRDRLKKIAFRVVVINIAFFLIKLTVDQDDFGETGFFTKATAFYYFSAFFFFMLTWEVNDWLLQRQLQKGGLDFKGSLRILGTTYAVLLPFILLTYYLGLFPLRDYLVIICDDPWLQFRTDVLRALLLGLAVIFFNMFYHLIYQKDELKKQLEDMRKEMMISRFSSLKNQISPHFLFNSLNTLTSLMYEDRDLASDFAMRLASSYRYILDNQELDLVSLEKELSFLDAYIFMMEVRHKGAVTISIDIRPNVRKWMIPTLSLQMLVENALKHNYFSKESPLKIEISAIGTDAIAIRNNLRKRKLEEETTRMGLNNIKKRYAYYTNKQVLVREEAASFEVILPLLDARISRTNLVAIS